MRRSYSVRARAPQLLVACSSPEEARALAGFRAELDAIERRDAAARLPLVLECSRCSTLYPWLATSVGRTLALSDSEIEGLPAEWLKARFNLIVRPRDVVVCPSCHRIDDYTFAEDPRPRILWAVEVIRGDGTWAAEQLRLRLLPEIIVDTEDTPFRDVILQCLGALEAGKPELNQVLHLASVAENSLQMSLAQRYLDRALEIDPCSVEALCAMGRIHLAQREATAAAGHLRHACDLFMNRKAAVVHSSLLSVAESVQCLLFDLRSRHPDSWSREDDTRFDQLGRQCAAFLPSGRRLR